MLYFIGDGERIKIGIAENPFERLKQLQTGNPLKLKMLLAIHLQNDGDIEQLLHDKLTSYHAHGEWFDISFASALDHLCAIRNDLVTGDSSVLRLENAPRPKLEDCREEFEQWIRDICWNDREWNQELYPVEYYWNETECREKFLQDRKAKRNSVAPIAAEKFALIRKSLGLNQKREFGAS